MVLNGTHTLNAFNRSGFGGTSSFFPQGFVPERCCDGHGFFPGLQSLSSISGWRERPPTGMRKGIVYRVHCTPEGKSFLTFSNGNSCKLHKHFQDKPETSKGLSSEMICLELSPSRGAHLHSPVQCSSSSPDQRSFLSSDAGIPVLPPPPQDNAETVRTRLSPRPGVHYFHTLPPGGSYFIPLHPSF